MKIKIIFFVLMLICVGVNGAVTIDSKIPYGGNLQSLIGATIEVNGNKIETYQVTNTNDGKMAFIVSNDLNVTDNQNVTIKVIDNNGRQVDFGDVPSDGTAHLEK